MEALMLILPGRMGMTPSLLRFADGLRQKAFLGSLVSFLNGEGDQVIERGL